jgi:multicomponent Na+:H+ antiporter subunit D
LLYCLFVFGIGKAAVMPFHRWLPAAMVAPTPVSALLHAVAVVKAGVFAILKVTIYVFGLDLVRDNGASNWLLWIAAATILIASLIALYQDNLKRRLAYSTISQLSYVVLGALLANAAGIIGGSMHIVMHAFGKITLFFCAGAILVVTHKTEISQMAGLGRRMPLTMGAFFLASVSIAGLPPLGGMWGKWYLALGSLDAGYSVLVGVLMLSTVLNIAYLLPIPVRAFFGAEEDVGSGGITEAPIACLIAIGVTTAMCLVLFLFPHTVYQLTAMLVD